MQDLSVCLATLLTAFLLISCSGKKSTDDMEGMTQSVDVALPTVDSVTLRKEYPALLAASQSVDVVARVNGYITARHFADGDMVRKGQTLFSIEDTQYRDAVASAEAALATARSQADYASRHYEAMKKALESDAVARIEVEQAESALTQARASIKDAEAALRTARTNLGYCTVTALADGHIAAPGVDIGDYVGGAAQPVKLTTIYNDSSMKAVFSITDAGYMAVLAEQLAATGALDSIPLTFSEALPHSYTGRLEYLAPDIDTSTGTMTVKLIVQNPYGELKDGMYAKVNLPVGTDPHALLVADAAISTDQRGKYLYVVNDSDKVVYTPITVGQLYQDTLRIVSSGLKPTDRYVTKALLKVRNGMKVKPTAAR